MTGFQAFVVVLALCVVSALVTPVIVLLAFKFNWFKPLDMYLDWLIKKIGD